MLIFLLCFFKLFRLGTIMRFFSLLQTNNGGSHSLNMIVWATDLISRISKFNIQHLELNIIYIFFKRWQLPASLGITTDISLIKETSTVTPKHLIKCHLPHLPHNFHNSFLRIFPTKKSSCLC